MKMFINVLIYNQFLYFIKIFLFSAEKDLKSKDYKR